MGSKVVMPQAVAQKKIFNVTKFMGPREQSTRKVLLGVDGGGTKTRAVITDSRYGVLGEAIAGPSNPLRVGFENAFVNIREAVEKACAAAGVEVGDIVSAEIGLAGVRRLDVRKKMYETLADLGIESLEILTDADIALYGATEGRPGMVIIAGTGSICCGINSQNRRACTGGWGPLAGDEGSGSWIARRALQAVAQASDGRGEATTLSDLAMRYFKTDKIEDLLAAIYAPTMTQEKIAGFCTPVVEAAKNGDRLALEIVSAAGHELGRAVAAAIHELEMERDKFQVAYVGGVFTAGDLVLEPMRAEIERVAPGAFLARPTMSPAVAAAHMAGANASQIALAG
jgi:glucosamine kinase